MNLAMLLELLDVDWSRQFIHIRRLLTLCFVGALAVRAPFAVHLLDILIKAQAEELTRAVLSVWPPPP